MKKINLITLLLIIAAFVSCKHEDTFYTVKGRLITSCSGNPVANQEISLKQASSIFGGGGVLGTTNTDANGNFSFSYNSKDCSNNDDLRINLSGPVIENIPTNENVELGTIYTTGIANFTISLMSNSVYSNLDTLYYTNYLYPTSNPIRIKVGPFNNQILDSITSYQLGGPFSYGINYTTLGIRYYVNHANMNRYKDIEFNVQNCGNWSNVNIVLE